MANAFFNSARHDVPLAIWDWSSTTIRAVLLDDSYVYDATDAVYADISAAVPASVSPVTLTTRAVSTTGTATADSVVFAGVDPGLTIQGVALYADLGGGTMRLIVWFDTGAGFPLTTTGADITVDWNATPGNGIVFTVN